MTTENLKIYTPQLYFRKYSFELQQALDTIDYELLDGIYELLQESYNNSIPILTFGNGGSAALANHTVSDLLKCVGHDVAGYFPPPAHSLCSNVPLMTCISNDYSYEEIFASQIEWWPFNKTICLGISSSGNSENIVRAFEEAVIREYNTVALVGFDGGKVLRQNLADIVLHVDVNNYGIVEDCHSIILHSLIQKLRINNAVDITQINL